MVRTGTSPGLAEAIATVTILSRRAGQGVGVSGGLDVITVFGLRGSRGSMADNSDSDNVLNAFVAKLWTRIPGASFEPIKYPAIPVNYGGPKAYVTTNYLDSMFAGVREFDRVLVAFMGACKTSYVVVVAYSQGTDATRETESAPRYAALLESLRGGQCWRLPRRGSACRSSRK